MKRSIVFCAILLLGASLAAAQPVERPPSRFSNPLLNEVVRMSNAGMGNETIIAYVKARQARLEYGLTADDLIELRRAGVGEPVIHFLASVTGFEGRTRPGQALEYGAEGPPPTDGETVAVDVGGYAPYYGGWGWGWGWGWPYWGWGGAVYYGHGGHGHWGHGGHWGGGHGGRGGHGGHGGRGRH